MQKEKTFWLSYDLGIRGDYESLYEWLDERQAKECGDSIATFRMICYTDTPQNEIKQSLLSKVDFKKTDRI